jgi:hypothetical protein
LPLKWRFLPLNLPFFVALASSEEVKGITEKCFEKKKETSTCPASYDEDLQKRLWIKTESLLGISFLKEEKKADKIF